MNSKKMHIDVISHSDVIWEGKANRVSAKALDGMVCVGFGHAEWVYPLVCGEIKIDEKVICNCKEGVLRVIDHGHVLLMVTV